MSKYIEIDIDGYLNSNTNWMGTSHLRYFPDEDIMVSYDCSYVEEPLSKFNSEIINSIIDSVRGDYTNQCPVNDSLEKMEQLNWVNSQCGKDFISRSDLESVMKTSQTSDELTILNEEEVVSFLKNCVK
jgi:hypothetical protein